MSAESESPTRLRSGDHPMAMKSMIYMNSMAWLAGFVRHLAENSDYSIDEIEAQVQKDLRFMLDQNPQTH